MRARIYRPARNAMTSGMAKTKKWVLDFAPETAREVDPLMGWTSSSDTQSQVRLRFDSKEDALEYARDHGIPRPASPTCARAVTAKTLPPTGAVRGRIEGCKSGQSCREIGARISRRSEISPYFMVVATSSAIC